MKIIYVYDALCGWCYGFSPVITEFYEKFNKEVDFEVVSGGMIRGDRIGPIGEVASYINRAYKDVENTSGVKFGDTFLTEILQEGSAIFTSVPPALALSVFKTHQPENSIRFASRLHKAIYYDGIKPDDFEAYGKLAGEFGINNSMFVSQMQEKYYDELAENDFQRSSSLGVTGFPTVILETADQNIVLSRGYVNLQTLENRFLEISGASNK